MIRKPMLADDVVLDKIIFPVVAQPKIDGVRALHHGPGHGLTGRSLKSHANRHTTQLYSDSVFSGFDGEMVVGAITDHGLCMQTTSALSTIKGEPLVDWWLFDYVLASTLSLGYLERYKLLEGAVKLMRKNARNYSQSICSVLPRIHVVPKKLCRSMDELLDYEQELLELGFEGVIGRAPNGKHKEGRSTMREGGLWRLKRFIEAEALVLGITEGCDNLNESKTNELGKKAKSSHKANKVPNGTVGNLQCRALSDEVCPFTGRLLIKKGQALVVSPGVMTAKLKKYYFDHPHEIVGQVVKYTFFPKGVKDKPRFPNFQSIRAASDR